MEDETSDKATKEQKEHLKSIVHEKFQQQINKIENAFEITQLPEFKIPVEVHVVEKVEEKGEPAEDKEGKEVKEEEQKE